MAAGTLRQIPLLTMNPRPLLLLCLLVVSCTLAQAQRRWTCQVEWGITGTFYTVHDLHYTTREGYHMDPRYTEASLHPNGFFGIQAGIRTGKRMQVDLCTGYYGLQSGIRSIPAGVRGTWHFGKRPDVSGGLGFAEGGIGFSDETGKKNADYLRAGFGYRTALGAGVYFKLLISGQLSLSHPIPYDPFDDDFVDPSRLSRSNRFAAGLSLGAAIGF